LFDPTRNLGAYIDRHSFSGHLSRGLYDTEGLLGTLLPATATTLLGVLTGIWLRSSRTLKVKGVSMLLAGLIGIGLGLLWGHWFPINKQLWTSSYVLYSAGWALIGLSICYWMIEIKSWRKRWTYIWLVFGTNAITAYVFSEFLGAILSLVHVPMGRGKVGLPRYWGATLVGHIPSHHLASLAYSLSIVAMCFIPVAIMYHKKIFLKV
jgi:predicted acyltransferase